MEELRNLGIVAVGKRAPDKIMGYYMFKEIPTNKLSKSYRKRIEKFVEQCERNEIMFKDAYLEIGKNNNIYLFNNSSINNIKGAFPHTLILYNHAHIDGGIFKLRKIYLFETAHINDGDFYTAIRLYNRAYIKSGILNECVYLKDSSTIKNAKFGKRCKVILEGGELFEQEDQYSNVARWIAGNWIEDSHTLDVLKKNKVEYYYDPSHEEYFKQIEEE